MPAKYAGDGGACFWRVMEMESQGGICFTSIEGKNGGLKGQAARSLLGWGQLAEKCAPKEVDCLKRFGGSKDQ